MPTGRSRTLALPPTASAPWSIVFFHLLLISFASLLSSFFYSFPPFTVHSRTVVNTHFPLIIFAIQFLLVIRIVLKVFCFRLLLLHILRRSFYQSIYSLHLPPNPRFENLNPLPVSPSHSPCFVPFNCMLLAQHFTFLLLHS